jgi:hypothetical protein
LCHYSSCHCLSADHGDKQRILVTPGAQVPKLLRVVKSADHRNWIDFFSFGMQFWAEDFWVKMTRQSNSNVFVRGSIQFMLHMQQQVPPRRHILPMTI